MKARLRQDSTPVLLIVLLGAIVLLTSLGTLTIRSAASTALITMIVVVALSIFSGNSGVFSFGHVAFMAVGAYVTTLTASSEIYKGIQLKELPEWLATMQLDPTLALLGAGAVAGVFAFLVALPLMRLNGLAASLATISLLIIIRVILQNWDRYTRGTRGLIVDVEPPSSSTLFLWTAAAIVVAWLFRRSRIGLRLIASREDEVAARATGIRVYPERIIAFTLSGFVAGVAGGLFALHYQSISPNSFYLVLTFMVVAMLVIGGVESLSGAVIGTIALSTVLEILRQVEEGISRPGISDFGLALALLAMLILRPAGLTGGRELRLPGQGPRQAPATEASPATAAAGTTTTSTTPN